MTCRFSVPVAVLVPLLCPVVLCACFFPAGANRSQQNSQLAEPDAGTAADWTSTTSNAHPVDAGVTKASAPVKAIPPTPFTKELKTLITQSVRWASVDVSVTGARLVRGLGNDTTTATGTSTAWSGARVTFDPAKVYAVLDLKLENKGDEETDYTDRATWDLLLKNGRRLASIDALGISMLPGDSATTTLHYETTEDADLAGAQFVLNGADRVTCEPEQIPLDVPYVQEFPRRITSMVGQTASYHIDNNRAAVHIDAAAYDANYARVGRAHRGLRVVWLELAFTPTDSTGGYFFNAGELRIVVAGRASAAQSGWYGYDIITDGTTQVLPVAFEIDKSATELEIMIPDGTPNGQRFPVKVADTVLATDIR